MLNALGQFFKKEKYTLRYIGFFLFILSSSITLSSINDLTTTLIFISCTLNSIAFILIFFSYQGIYNNLNFLSVFIIGWAIANIYPQLYLSIRVSEMPLVDEWGTAKSYSIVSMITIFSILITIFSYNIYKPKFKKTDQQFDKIYLTSKFLNYIIIIYSFAWIARIILFINGAYYFAYKDETFMFGTWYSMLGQISLMGQIIFLIVFLLRKNSSKHKSLSIYLFILELIWLLPSGARASIALLFISILFVLWWENKRLPIKKIFVFITILLVTFPTLGVYRYAIKQFAPKDKISLESSFNAIKMAEEIRDDKEFRSGFNFIDSFISRLYDGNSLGYIYEHYSKRYKFELGSTVYRNVVGIVVPYFLIPTRRISQLTINEWFPHLQAGGSSPATFLGEAYINFGYLGFFIFPFFLGLLLASLDRFFLTRKNNLVLFVLYIYLLQNFVFMHSQNFVTILSTLRLVFLFGLFFHFSLLIFGIRAKIK